MKTSHWKPKEIASAPDGLILFDGVCHLCSGWVRFLIENDPSEHFIFTPVQSPYGRALAVKLGINPDAPESNAIVVNGRAYFKFDSIVEALGALPRWRWVHAARILPRFMRDWIYDRIANNRYRVFGKSKDCMIPHPDVIRRFILDNPSRMS